MFKISNFWDEQTVRLLEELSVRTATLSEAVEESARSQPSVPPIEKLKDLERSGYPGRVVELTAPFLKWKEQHDSAKRAWSEAMVELAGLCEEMVRQRSDVSEKLLAHVIFLEREGVSDERTYVLYRSAIWCSKQELKPEQWQIVVERFLEREDAELAAALVPFRTGRPRNSPKRTDPV